MVSKRVTKYAIYRDGRRVRKHHLMDLPTVEAEVRSLNARYEGHYTYHAVREDVKSGYRARNRRSARTESYLRRE